MKTYKNLYPEIYNLSNLILAWRKARKGKTKKEYVIEFEKDLIKNLLKLQEELKNQTYFPLPLVTFALRDPKTRKISKSNFRDRIVHHALILIIGHIFEKSFIYDSYANQIGKGTIKAVQRFNKFIRIVSKNNTRHCFILKADIKHYFQEVDHEILLNIIKRIILDNKIILLIEGILNNREIGGGAKKVGIPLGNLTSQFFANVYLNELDYFIKHKLKTKGYIRYVDDFVLLHNSKKQLKIWEQKINDFLKEKLKLELHPQKSRIISLKEGIDFVGFRNFYNFKLLRNRNIKSIYAKINNYRKGEIFKEKLLEILQGWQAYAKWANSFKLRKKILREINKPSQIISTTFK